MMSRARISLRASFIAGGRTAPRIGTLLTKADVWIMFGQLVILLLLPIRRVSCVMRADGKSRRIMRLCLQRLISNALALAKVRVMGHLEHNTEINKAMIDD